MSKYKEYVNPVNNHTVQVKEGFSWMAMLFGPIFYFMNGMIGKGLAWLLAAVVVSPTVVGPFIVWIIAGAKGNKAKEERYLEKGYTIKNY
jgi:hypothetical protein